MTATVLAPYLKQRFVDANGAPLYLGTVATFAAGTNTPIVTYKDAAGIATNTNPITLNPRGECDIWLLPNVAYKFQVNDAAGNLIWTEDNVVNSQLLTLYGGVDTGSVNAYILNFTANFTAYVDGIVIYWIPANTNTGASTINVNGLGTVNILNADGSALAASAITANQPATILFKSGAFILISATTTSYGTFPCTWVGFSVPPINTTIQYRKNGTLVTLIFPLAQGTSNSTLFRMTGLPAFLTPNAISVLGNYSISGLEDNGALLAGGMATILNNNSITFFKDGTQPAWTASGVKGFGSQTALTYTL